MVNSCHIFGRNKLLHIFTFWLEEYVIPFYNDFNNQERTDEWKHICSSVRKNNHIFKKFVKEILCLCKNIPEKNLTIHLRVWYGNILFEKWQMTQSLFGFKNQLRKYYKGRKGSGNDFFEG